MSAIGIRLPDGGAVYISKRRRRRGAICLVFKAVRVARPRPDAVSLAERQAALPLLIGEAPNTTDQQFSRNPLSGGPSVMIARLLGHHERGGESQRDRYLRCWMVLRRDFMTTNLLDRYPGPQGRGAAFDTERGRAAVEALPHHPCYVALGVRVAAAMGLRPAFFELQAFRGRATWVIPHPSGLNRMYNSAAVRSRAGLILHEAIDEARRCLTLRATA